VIPSAVAAPVEGYLRRLESAAGGRLAAVYLVGARARHALSQPVSNIHVVVVSDTRLEGGELRPLRRLERSLERPGHPPAVWYTDWKEISEGSPVAGSSPLDTPMTRAILREDAVALLGPDWPVVAYDDTEFRAWCRAQLQKEVAASHALMVMRRAVVPVVLEAARLAQGAVTGRVLSKSEAGETATELVKPHFRRILTDAVGFRQGAHTSMYWGPFERKYDARQLVGALAEAAGA
jgi:hypothetical protein